MRSPEWCSGKAFDPWSWDPGLHWILWVFVKVKKDTLQPQSSTGETQERYEWCELLPWNNWNNLESGVQHKSINQSINRPYEISQTIWEWILCISLPLLTSHTRNYWSIDLSLSSSKIAVTIILMNSSPSDKILDSYKSFENTAGKEENLSLNVFSPFGEHSIIFIKFEMVVCKLFSLESSKICWLGKGSNR